jgi:hypothetical protein
MLANPVVRADTGAIFILLATIRLGRAAKGN